MTLICMTLVVGLLAGADSAASATDPPAKDIDAAVLLTFPTHPKWGFSLSIAHGGRVVYERGYGFRDDGTPDNFIAKDQNYYSEPVARPASPRAKADARTIYSIGSVTRQFTAAAILLLSEQHRLNLDDEVSRYVPEFRDPALTVRSLLTQRSGLPESNSLAFLGRVRPLAKRTDGSLDEARISREIAASPPDFAPETRFEYSSSNYFILGRIVERVAAEPLGAYLREKFFEPLGMTRTAYARSAATDDVAVGYRIDEKGSVYRAYPWDLEWLGGAGAMTSTVQDLSRWNIALIEHHVLSPESLAQMWHGLDAGRGQGSYAMGWIEDALGSHRYLWHNGQVGGFHALDVIFPDDDLAFAILTNNQDAKPEYLLPGLAALYFPVTGIDRILPHSGVVLVEASLAVGIGALAIAIVAIVTLKRFIAAGIAASLLALLAGFFLPTIMGFVWAGIAALVPTLAYVLAVQFIPKKIVEPKKKIRSRS